MKHTLHRIIALGIILMTSLLQGATHSSARMPQTDEQSATAQVQSMTIEISTPLFTREHMARNASPQWLTMLNNPTQENARAEALARLYRKLHIAIANAMVRQEEGRMMARAKLSLGKDEPTDLELLKAIATTHGPPDPRSAQ